jgi:hypothetical protein
VTIASIDADIETKQANFDDKVTKFLPFYVNEVTTILNGAKTDGERTKDLSQQQLTLYKGYLDKIKTVRHLTTAEQSLYDVIDQRIKGTYKGDEIPTPTSDLTGPTLLNLLGAKTGVKESDVNFSD